MLFYITEISHRFLLSLSERTWSNSNSNTKRSSELQGWYECQYKVKRRHGCVDRTHSQPTSKHEGEHTDRQKNWGSKEKLKQEANADWFKPQNQNRIHNLNRKLLIASFCFFLVKVSNVCLFYPGLINASAEPAHEAEAPVHSLNVPSLASEEFTIVVRRSLQGTAGEAKPGPIPKLLPPEPHNASPHQVRRISVKFCRF